LTGRVYDFARWRNASGRAVEASATDGATRGERAADPHAPQAEQPLVPHPPAAACTGRIRRPVRRNHAA
jgi:hypothetical protein